MEDGTIIKHIRRDRVKINFGRTIPLGNYESFRVDVGMESDLRKGEALDEGYTRVTKEVEEKLEEICKPVMKSLENYEDRRKKGGR